MKSWQQLAKTYADCEKSMQTAIPKCSKMEQFQM
jgi:hypothetical protein